MRSASRSPGLPVSTSSDWPDGETNSVDCPPSTSMEYTSSGFGAWVWTIWYDAATAAAIPIMTMARVVFVARMTGASTWKLEIHLCPELEDPGIEHRRWS